MIASSAAGALRTRTSFPPAPTSLTKQNWYIAEQNLRNQIDRTYDARMSFTLEELQTPGPGKGVLRCTRYATSRAYLEGVIAASLGHPQAIVTTVH